MKMNEGVHKRLTPFLKQNQWPASLLSTKGDLNGWHLVNETLRRGKPLIDNVCLVNPLVYKLLCQQTYVNNKINMQYYTIVTNWRYIIVNSTKMMKYLRVGTSSPSEFITNRSTLPILTFFPELIMAVQTNNLSQTVNLYLENIESQWVIIIHINIFRWVNQTVLIYV